MKLFLNIFLIIFMVSCGNDPIPGVEATSSESAKDDSMAADTAGEDATTTLETVDDGLQDQVLFRGYVSNGFEVVVNGETYADLEEFYTIELSRLPEKASESGYDGYDVHFSAELGFVDLFQDMTVYVAPDAAKGYQGQSRVDRDGAFSVAIPEKGLEESYKVRANKRISVEMTNGDERVTMCYNFSAIEKSVLLSDTEKPVILRNFSSTLTAYDCPKESSIGELEIPDAPSEDGDRVEISPILLKPKMTKKSVLAAIGEQELVISGNKWCLEGSANASHPLCAVERFYTCSCYLGFDEDGALASQSNIKSQYLDVLAW